MPRFCVKRLLAELQKHIGNDTRSDDAIPDIIIKVLLPPNETRHFKNFEVDMPDFGVSCPDLKRRVSFDRVSITGSNNPVVMDVSFLHIVTS